MSSRGIAVALLLGMMVVALTGCAGSTVRTYAGPELKAGEVVKIHETDEIRLVAVDGTQYVKVTPGGPRAGDDSVLGGFLNPQQPVYRSRRTYELSPGTHRIAAQYYKIEGNRVRYGINQMTFLHNFEAGKDYSFGVVTLQGPDRQTADPKTYPHAGIAIPVLLDKGTGETVARPEGMAAMAGAAARPGGSSPPAASAAPAPSGAIVTGTARVYSEKGVIYTAAGREVILAPDTPEVGEWLIKRLQFRASSFNLLPPPGEPDVMKKRSLRTLGFGTGQFAFQGVAPGDYLVIFDAGPKESMATAKVSVAPGQARIDNIRADSGTPPR